MTTQPKVSKTEELLIGLNLMHAGKFSRRERKMVLNKTCEHLVKQDIEIARLEALVGAAGEDTGS